MRPHVDRQSVLAIQPYSEGCQQYAATPTKRKLTATTINPRQPPEHPTARRPNVRRNQRHSLSVIVVVVRRGQQLADVRHSSSALRSGSLPEIVPPSGSTGSSVHGRYRL